MIETWTFYIQFIYYFYVSFVKARLCMYYISRERRDGTSTPKDGIDNVDMMSS